MIINRVGSGETMTENMEKIKGEILKHRQF